MRRVIMIAGITAAGKTTAAQRLGQYLCMPAISIDTAFDMIGGRVGYIRTDELVWPATLAKFRDGDQMKREAYAAMIPPEGDFIVEGFPLGFAADREMLAEIIGNHELVFFHLKPPIGQWKRQARAKGMRNADDGAWGAWQAAFEAPADHYEISNPAQLIVSHETYQRDGLTDVKWKQLDVSENMSGARIVDFGCNAGMIGKYCLDRGAAEVVGVDNNWRYLQDAKAAGCQTILADMNDPDFQSRFEGMQTFDFVFCLSALQYIKDEPAFIDFLSKIVRQTGQCIIEVPISRCINPQRPDLRGEVEALEAYNGMFIPTMSLMMNWLKSAFANVKIAGKSITPDGSASERWIFKCGHQ